MSNKLSLFYLLYLVCSLLFLSPTFSSTRKFDFSNFLLENQNEKEFNQGLINNNEEIVTYKINISKDVSFT